MKDDVNGRLSYVRDYWKDDVNGCSQLVEGCYHWFADHEEHQDGTWRFEDGKLILKPSKPEIAETKFRVWCTTEEPTKPVSIQCHLFQIKFNEVFKVGTHDYQE